MATMTEKRSYRPTESQYKGVADEMYITYDREQKTRSGNYVTYPKVKRIYIAGDVKDWKVGSFKKRSGREVHGVRIEYEQSRKGYRRQAYSAKRGKTTYKVSPATVKPVSQKFTKVVEIPEQAKNVRFHKDARQLPNKYKQALQNVR
jgi:hypothetical protein